jgi:hypothetical protein
MKFSDHADQAVKSIAEVLGVMPSEDQARNINHIIQTAIINAVLDERSRCATVAMNVCEADQDLAHKISAEIRRTNEALIANLSSMR